MDQQFSHKEYQGTKYPVQYILAGTEEVKDQGSSNPQQQSIKVEKVIVHEDYNKNCEIWMKCHDIALIKVHIR